MIDTLMALWNRGYGGRGILVSTAFFLICISISLLLASVGASWTSWFTAGSSPARQKSIVGATNLTATSQSGYIHPVADNTASIYAPTATPTAARPCTITTAEVSNTPALKASTTVFNGGSNHSRPTLTPTQVHPTPTQVRPTPTQVKVTPTPRITPTTTPTPGITPTATPTPRITPTATPTPGITPTATPTLGITPTATRTPGITPTATPTLGVTPTNMPTATPTITTAPTIIVTAATSLHLRRSSVGSIPAGITKPKQSGTSASNNCLHSGVGDSVDLNSDSSIIAIVEGNLWLILGGSVLGTLIFYITIYFLLRKSQTGA